MKLRGLGCQGGVSVFTLKKHIFIIFKKYSNSQYSQILFYSGDSTNFLFLKLRLVHHFCLDQTTLKWNQAMSDW